MFQISFPQRGFILVRSFISSRSAFENRFFIDRLLAIYLLTRAITREFFSNGFPLYSHGIFSHGYFQRNGTCSQRSSLTLTAWYHNGVRASANSRPLLSHGIGLYLRGCCYLVDTLPIQGTANCSWILLKLRVLSEFYPSRVQRELHVSCNIRSGPW